MSRSSWPKFSSNELMCRCGCGQVKMDPEFMEKLCELRVEQYGKAMVVSSAYRCPAYNDRISKTGIDGPHTTGRAIDIKVHGPQAVKLLDAIFQHGDFTGIGIKQNGPYKGRFIHIDDLLSAHGRNRPWVWTY